MIPFLVTAHNTMLNVNQSVLDNEQIKNTHTKIRTQFIYSFEPNVQQLIQNLE